MWRYKTNKYGNKKVLVNGEKFDSKRELRRYYQLLALQGAKEIRELQKQIKYELQEGFRDFQGKWHRPITYTADFVYRDKKYNWNVVVEDAKGFRTEVFKIKKKLLIKKYPHVIFLET